MKISDKELQEYVAAHKDEIKKFINEKAEKVIKAEIRSAFQTEDSYYNRKEGYARKLIRIKVEDQTKQYISKTDFKVDEQILKEKISKVVNRQISRVKARIEIEM